MLTLRDCLDYCSLTEEEIGLLAEHHDLPAEAAGLIACSLSQSVEGIVVLTNWLLEIAEQQLQLPFVELLALAAEHPVDQQLQLLAQQFVFLAQPRILFEQFFDPRITHACHRQRSTESTQK